MRGSPIPQDGDIQVFTPILGRTQRCNTIQARAIPIIRKTSQDIGFSCFEMEQETRPRKRTSPFCGSINEIPFVFAVWNGPRYGPHPFRNGVHHPAQPKTFVTQLFFRSDNCCDVAPPLPICVKKSRSAATDGRGMGNAMETFGYVRAVSCTENWILLSRRHTISNRGMRADG